MKKFMVILVLVAFTATGCTGSFMLTKKIYNWHRGLDGKWADEFGFLVCAILPIYGLGSLADAIVFNSIEFWTGENPVENAKADNQNKIVKVGDEKAVLSYNAEAKELKIASQKKGIHPIEIALERSGDTLITKDKNGGILFTTTKAENGDYLVYNRNSELVRTVSKDEVLKMGQKYTR